MYCTYDGLEASVILRQSAARTYRNSTNLYQVEYFGYSSKSFKDNKALAERFKNN